MQGAADDERHRVTPALLRQAETMCPRRLWFEHTGRKHRGNPGADARFAVSNRLLADARLAQAEPGVPRPEAFVEPAELEPEQQSLYRAAVRGYLALFGDRVGRVVDLGWTTVYTDLEVDLVGNAGLPVELPGGGRELRVVHLGGRRAGAPLLSHGELTLALVRTRGWATTELRIVGADVIEHDIEHYTPDLVAERADADAWVSSRVEILRTRAHIDQPIAGADCQGCAWIAGCTKHPG